MLPLAGIDRREAAAGGTAEEAVAEKKGRREEEREGRSKWDETRYLGGSSFPALSCTMPRHSHSPRLPFLAAHVSQPGGGV